MSMVGRRAKVLTSLSGHAPVPPVSAQMSLPPRGQGPDLTGEYGAGSLLGADVVSRLDNRVALIRHSRRVLGKVDRYPVHRTSPL